MVTQLLSDGNAGDAQRVANAIVRLHEDANQVLNAADCHAPRRGADATLELVADHARAAADVAFSNCTPRRALQGSRDMLGADRKSVV